VGAWRWAACKARPEHVTTAAAPAHLHDLLPARMHHHLTLVHARRAPRALEHGHLHLEGMCIVHVHRACTSCISNVRVRVRARACMCMCVHIRMHVHLLVIVGADDPLDVAVGGEQEPLHGREA